ncbi:MAG: MBL fold metallo-hydrolase [Balneolaceae bacterium]
MKWLKKNSVVILGEDDLVREVMQKNKLSSDQVVVLERKDQLVKILYAEEPDLVVLDGQKITDSAEILGEVFSTSPGIRFVPILMLTDDSELSKKLYSDIVCSISFFEKKGEEEIFFDKVQDLLQESIAVKFWGVRGSTPCANSENIKYGGNTSCVQIKIPRSDRQLILDCGTGLRNLGNHLLSYKKEHIVGDIFITHPHWDHIQGFPFFKPLYNRLNSFSVSLPEQYRGGAREILSGHLPKTFFPVTLNMLSADLTYITREEEKEEFPHFSVEYLVANHPTKTAMYRFAINGYSIIYAPDNEVPVTTSPIRFLEQYEKFISGCDLLIHDAQYDQEMYKKREGWGHSSWERVVELAKKNGVKRLFLTHHDPDSSDDALKEIDKKLKSYKGNPFLEIGLTKEGSQVRLPIGLK